MLNKNHSFLSRIVLHNKLKLVELDLYFMNVENTETLYLYEMKLRNFGDH